MMRNFLVLEDLKELVLDSLKDVTNDKNFNSLSKAQNEEFIINSIEDKRTLEFIYQEIIDKGFLQICGAKTGREVWLGLEDIYARGVYHPSYLKIT